MSGTITHTTGTYYFTSLDGPVDHPGEKLKAIRRANYPGVRYRKHGEYAQETVLTGVVDVDGAGTAGALMVSHKQMEGSFVNFTNDQGNSYVNFICLEVRHGKLEPILGSVGGLDPDSTHLVRVWITVQYPYGS